MLRSPLFLLIFSFLTFNLQGQSFTDVDELLDLSEMDPLECEKALTAKGFKFLLTDGLESAYSLDKEFIFYKISPRSVHYETTDRSFFLEVNSRLIKKGFVLVDAEATIEDDDYEFTAQKYEKGKFMVWLYTADYGSTYHIFIENNDPSSIKKPKSSSSSNSSKSEYKYRPEKEPIDYGYFYVGLIVPRGIIAEDPVASSSLRQDYTGESGIGAKEGFESGITGVLGFTKLNKQLPRFMDLGMILGAQFGVQPFSYESLGAPYDDYSYTGFWKLGAGLGPALTISPLPDADLRLSAFYKIDAAVCFGGTFEYVGSQSFEQELDRDKEPFAWIKSYGLNLKTGGFFGGIEFSKYTDKGTFILTNSVYDPNSGQYYDSEDEMKANLPIQQMTLKVGLAF